MNAAPDNVTPLNKLSGNKDQHPSSGGEPSSGMDLAKIAIIISLLSVVLSVIFFFGLNRNLSGLSNEVKDIGAIRTNVAALDAYVDDILEQMGRVNTRIMELEEKPRKEAVRVLQQSMINDMLRRAEFMQEQLSQVDPDDTATAAKLERLQGVLKEFTSQDQTQGAATVVPVIPAPATPETGEVLPEQDIAFDTPQQGGADNPAIMEQAAPAPVGPQDESAIGAEDVQEPSLLVPAPSEQQFVPAPDTGQSAQ